MASSYDDHNARADGGGEEGSGTRSFSGSTEVRQVDAPQKTVWAGVKKGRDGLLGRIEIALGSIS